MYTLNMYTLLPVGINSRLRVHIPFFIIISRCTHTKNHYKFAHRYKRYVLCTPCCWYIHNIQSTQRTHPPQKPLNIYICTYDFNFTYCICIIYRRLVVVARVALSRAFRNPIIKLCLERFPQLHLSSLVTVFAHVSFFSTFP